jgi:hypothetical protein
MVALARPLPLVLVLGGDLGHEGFLDTDGELDPTLSDSPTSSAASIVVLMSKLPGLTAASPTTWSTPRMWSSAVGVNWQLTAPACGPVRSA